MAKASHSSLFFVMTASKPNATEYNASVGQFENQSIVVQLTRDGNIRHLRRKASPTGDIDKTTCKLFRTRFIKNL